MLSVGDISVAARPLLERYGFLGATLFGSYAKGCASERSDVDVFVDVPAGTKTKEVLSFGYDLGVELGVDVDAYGSHEVKRGSTLLSEIVATGVSL